jgi:signal peptidase I
LKSIEAMPCETVHPRRRTLIERLVWLLIGLLIVRTWVLDGFPVPCQVSGGSMAETLLGTHYEIVCVDCGYPFVCEANAPLDRYQAICPNCGCAVQSPEPPPELAGDRVLIDKSAFTFRQPYRWEVIAFRRPVQGPPLAVKRVVGLPGESIRIRSGDVYADGQVQRKTLLQQRALRMLIHDADYYPSSPESLPRWHSPANSGQWKWTEGRQRRLAHQESSGPGSLAGQSIDWLVYTHVRRLDRQGKLISGPVDDLCSYNQGRPRREEDVHWVPDVQLSLRVAATSGPGLFWLRATDGREEFLTRIDPAEGSYAVLYSGHPNAGAAGRLPSPLAGSLIEMSLFDQQFLLAVNGQAIATLPWERPEGMPPPCVAPLGVGVQGLGIVLENLKVYRDVYYTSPSSATAAADPPNGVALAENEFFVLGDNSPISEDSRTWSKARAVAAHLLLGRPLLVVFPAGGACWGQRHFQVPQPSRIRYIR